MTTQKEIQKLLAEGWIMTDPSCNQMRKEILENRIYEFREDRIINPITKETKVFAEELDYKNHNWNELQSACSAFGYTEEQIDEWIASGKEIPLMLECIFELDT
jgi:hypothetical protein